MPKPGLLLDRYRIIKEVGRGGQGAVYLCEDLRLSGRLWAVKELDCQAEREQAFEREAAVLSQLDHPRIPVIVDFFVQAGRGYLVREFLDGPTLYDLIENRGPLSEAQALQWAGQIAEVLEYLHHRSPPLYHRDLKPANIVILPDGVRVMDFGLARDAGETPANGEVGSVSFSAPEQFSGKVAPGPQGDIYSLGAILYYMLMGVPPGPTGGEHRLLPQRPQLHPTTEELIVRCMKADPADRPADVSEVLHSLQFNSARLPPPPRPILPRPLDPDEPALKAAREPSRWTVGAAVLPLLLLLALVGLLMLSQARRSARVAVPPPVSPAPSNLVVDYGTIRQYLASHQFAEAEGALRATLAGDPDCGWARLLLVQLPLLRAGRVGHVPLLLPLGGSEEEHVNWILQGVALGQMEEKRFVFDLLDTHRVPVLQAWQNAVSQHPGLVVGPFGSQDALLVAPLAAGSGIPTLPIGSTDPRVQSAAPDVFPLGFPHWERIAALLAHAVQKRGGPGLILYSADSKAMSTSGQVAARHVAGLPGGSSRMDSYNTEENVDEVTARVRAVDPKWIYLSENLPDRAAKWIRALRQAGVRVPIICVFHPSNHSFVEALDDVPGQVWLVEPLWQERCQPFVARWQEIFGVTGHADWNSALGYDAARLVGRVWAPDVAGVLANARRVAHYEGLLGTYDLKDKKFQPHAFPFRMEIVEGGEAHPGPVL